MANAEGGKILIGVGNNAEMLGIPEDSKWYWPAHVELGSPKHPALPYLRPAFDDNKAAMLNAFRDKLWSEVKVMWQRGH